MLYSHTQKTSIQQMTLACIDSQCNAEQGILAARRGGKREKLYDLGSERSGEHLRYITQPWFQDDLGVVRPEFQASRVDGKGLQFSYSLDRRQC